MLLTPEFFEKAYKKYSKDVNTIGKDNLSSLYSFVGLETENGCFSRYKAVSYLMDRAVGILENAPLDEAEADLERLMKHYIYRHVRYGDNIGGMLACLYTISEPLRQAANKEVKNRRPLTKREFVTAVKLCIRYACISDTWKDNILEHMEHLKPELLRHAKTLVEVETLVPRAVVDKGELTDKEGIAGTLFRRIEDRITRYGPRKFFEEVLKLYISSYDSKYGVFRLNSPTGKLLYNLTLKQCTRTDADAVCARAKGSVPLASIDRLARALVGLYDFRIDSQFKLLILNKDPVKYMQEVVFHDALYKELQYPPEAILLILERLLKPHEAKLQDIMSMSIDEFISISGAIIRYSVNEMERGFVNAGLRVGPDDIFTLLSAQGSNITRAKVENYFKVMVTGTALNEKYNHPLDTGGINADSSWLIKADKSSSLLCWLPLPPISCFGLYDRIMGLLGFPNAGYEFEGFIRNWMHQAFNTEVYSGKYIYNGKVYESDGILVLGCDILLLECKTKPMTRIARSGHIGHAFIDLSKAFLQSTLQAYRCEAAFRTGKLELFDSGCKDSDILHGKAAPFITLQLPQSPEFWRISCTTFNFGTFIENAVVKNLLKAFMYHNYRADEEKVQQSIDEFEGYRDELMKVWGDIKQCYAHGGEDRIFHNITFNTFLMPFGLLYILTSGGLSDKSPMERLRRFKFLQPGNYDIYNALSIVFL